MAGYSNTFFSSSASSTFAPQLGSSDTITTPFFSFTAEEAFETLTIGETVINDA